ncbi:Zn(II)2Cys6 transcription factor domain-containing protein [Aspergillus lucknowensis]|uniref:Zn(2)-C6 fungal-type domain-containing protein n=1 Tax=Aspergillus lucknowensis TaxID=176173 RepID=A0ABR4LWJ0_9EURO
MPGAPVGKACNACRESKKKCDQTRPSCSRCTRLGIECVGSGAQRFKFMDEYNPHAPRKREPMLQIEAMRPVTYRDGVAVLAPAPRSSTLALAEALVTTFRPGTDLRYHLAWAYGGYLAMVPARLGKNEALDSAVDALVTTHRSFCARREISVAALTKYSRSLAALRDCLADVRKSSSSETLCAVSILLLVQNLLGSGGEQWTGHCEGAAKILKARKSCKPRDDFERIIMMSLRGPVLFEGILNQRITFTPDEWSQLITNDLDGTSPESALLLCMAKIPPILHRARAHEQQAPEIHDLCNELRTEYTSIRHLCDDFQARLAALETLSQTRTGKPTPKPSLQHAHFQRTYGLAMIVALYFSFVITGLGGGDARLRADASYLGTEIVRLAERAAIYRPLGAGYVLLCLILAWMGVVAVADTHNRSLRWEIERALAEYRSDFFHQDLSLDDIEEMPRRLFPLHWRGRADDGWLVRSVEHATYAGV